MGMSRETRKRQVLAMLRAESGRWVPSHKLANAVTGGSEGLRRLRELRQEGHTIELHREDGRTFYRIIESTTERLPTGGNA